VESSALRTHASPQLNSIVSKGRETCSGTRHSERAFGEWTGVTIRTEHGPIDRHEEVVLSPADVGDARWNHANL
jgi:hypothetical protein